MFTLGRNLPNIVALPFSCSLYVSSHRLDQITVFLTFNIIIDNPTGCMIYVFLSFVFLDFKLLKVILLKVFLRNYYSNDEQKKNICIIRAIKSLWQ